MQTKKSGKKCGYRTNPRISWNYRSTSLVVERADRIDEADQLVNAKQSQGAGGLIDKASAFLESQSLPDPFLQGT
jgi:hypothetical protein